MGGGAADFGAVLARRLADIAAAAARYDAFAFTEGPAPPDGDPEGLGGEDAARDLALAALRTAGDPLAYAMLRPLARTAVRFLAWRCAVSSDAQATAEAALGGTYEPVFNGIETERFAKATAWPTAGPTIVFIGRHEPRKGVETLLAAFGRLPPDTRLWMVGEGPQTAELRQRTADEPPCAIVEVCIVE